MASTPMVTRCPQCKTSFRITPAQLESARGTVRCGSCLHIFKARDHLVGAAPSPKSDSALVRKPSKAGQTADGGTTAKARAQKPKAAKAPKAVATPSTPEAPKAVNKPAPHPTQGKPKQDRPVDADDDDLLISDHMYQPSRKETSRPSMGVSDSLSHSLFERKERSQSKLEEEPTEDPDESWAQSLLEEDEQTDAQIQLKPSSDARNRAEEERDWAESFALVEEPGPVEPDRGDQGANLDREASEAATEGSFGGDTSGHTDIMHADIEDRADLLHQIHPEPVDMGWMPQKHNRAKWLWGGLSVLALLVLIGQLAWWQFDRLGRIEPYRSIYGQVCGLIGCELPGLTDPSRIRAYNLVVRDHPEVQDALMIDAILLNTAGFAQPFPELVLEFSDLNDQLVAKRSFKPDEYLSGEMAGRETMPPNQPVHLTLELVDPGEQAVNYRAYIPQ